MSDGAGPLAGLQVLDLSRKGPGAFATMVLGDLGADVVVVEAPGSARASYVGVSPHVDTADPARAASWDPLRRNKRFVELDLKDAAGRAALDALLERADVFVETFRPGVVERLGYGYERVRGRLPGLVYCSLSGYGQDSPLAGLPGHDLNYAAYGGLLAAVQEEDRRPVPPLNLVADWSAGSLVAVVGILAALRERESSGLGQRVDVSITDGVLYLLANAVAELVAGGVEPVARHHTLTGGLPHYDCYRCADGSWLSVAPLEAPFHERFVAALGLGPAASDEERRAELRALFARRPAAEWFELLAEADVPVAPVLALADALGTEHVAARRMVQVLDGPGGEPVTQVGVVPALSRTPGAIRRIGTPPGTHTAEVLGAAGVAIANPEGPPS